MTVHIDVVWERIRRHAGESFRLTGGAEFTYEVPGNYLRPVGRVRHLSRTNFAKALPRLPLSKTTDVKDLQGPSYVYAILMDPRVSQGDW